MKIDLNPLAYQVVKHLEKHGFEAWIVGGAVRDLILGLPTLDWDFATNATPEEILPLFVESFYDNNFGTVMVAVKHLQRQFKLDDNSLDGEVVFDITTYRSEQGYSDRRRPDKVIWGRSIEEDLNRRDFTMNAIAAKVISPSEWELLDPYHGQADIQAKLIRAVGDPRRRFEEDALRMLRAVRFAAQLGFQIEPQTFQAIQALASNLKFISWERIGDEFMKLLQTDHPADGVLLLVNSGLAAIILPELVQAKGIPQAGHHIYDVFTHMIESLRACPSKDPVVRLATLLHDIGKPITFKSKNGKITFYNHEVIGARVAKKIAGRLRLSKKDQDLIFTLVRWHMFAYDRQMTDAAIRRFIRRVGKENIHKMMMLRIGDRVGGGSKATSWRLNEFQKRIGEQLYEPLSLKDLKINGHDIMDHFQLKPGPVIGKILNQLFEEVLDNPDLNAKDRLLARAAQLLPTYSSHSEPGSDKNSEQ